MNNSQKEESALFDELKRFLKKPFGRFSIEKHENQVYLEVTDKKKLTIK